MAYEKQTWKTGDVITQEKLNHMEDGIAEGGDCGFECTETTEQLFTETVTTVQYGDVVQAQLTYSEPITADELTVIFNGTQYICPKVAVVDGANNSAFYGEMSKEGDPVFTNYPFFISSAGVRSIIATESPMAVTVSASVTSSTIETTECFEKAVCESVFYVVKSYVTPAQELELSKTWQEIYDAAETKVVLLKRREDSKIHFEYLTYLNETSGIYRVTFGNQNNFTADSKDDYPTQGGGK